MRLFAHITLAIFAGFLLMVPLGWLYDTMNWPTFHMWGLAHGAFFSAWPSLTLISLVLLSLLSWFRRPMSDAVRIVLALSVGLAIAGWVVVAEPAGRIHVPNYLLAVSFILSAALSMMACRPWLIALAIAAPCIFFDAQFLMMSWESILSYFGSRTLGTVFPILICVCLGAGVSYAFRKRVRPNP